MSARTQRRAAQNGNGSLATAVASEVDLASRASEIRGDATFIDADLFLKLLPLLREPIPAGYIEHIGVVIGKPYESTGIKSVQVQIDRMHNVLTPLGWRERVEYHEGGKLAHVTVEVINVNDAVLARAESWGGVDRASTLGNLYKGSYTNAAKIAFARLGPGHEVYVGATDLDPDVHQGVAALQERPAAASDIKPTGEAEYLTTEQESRLRAAFAQAGVDKDGLGTFLMAVGAGPNDRLKKVQAFTLRELLDKHIARTTGGDVS